MATSCKAGKPASGVQEPSAIGKGDATGAIYGLGKTEPYNPAATKLRIFARVNGFSERGRP
jgi:hypothetical protein